MDYMPIAGCPGYFATPAGHIYSDKTEKLLSERENRLGYKRVNMYVGGKTITREVHQLVMEAFKGEAESGYRILHGAGGIQDNRPENLRYGTQYDNMQDKHRDGTDPTGSRNPFAKLDETKVAAIKAEMRTGARNVDLAGKYEISVSTISKIKAGVVWAHVA